MEPIRLIDTGLADPAYTAALDETLLESAVNDGITTLHLYRRDPPSVTLGYFLDAEENVDLMYCKANQVKVIRRISGGGAIYTDKGQLVYGLACKGLLPASTIESFKVVCGAIARALRTFGCDCQYSPVNDVTVNGRKVSGSALVQRGKGRLMHGTIIVEIDRSTMFKALRVPEDKMRSKGLSGPEERVISLTEDLGKTVSMEEVKAAMSKAIGEEFGRKVEISKLREEEIILTQTLLKEKYGADEWNFKKTK